MTSHVTEIMDFSTSKVRGRKNARRQRESCARNHLQTSKCKIYKFAAIKITSVTASRQKDLVKQNFHQRKLVSIK